MPVVVRAVVESTAQTPQEPVSKAEQGWSASRAFKESSGTLRGLAERKIQIQSEIEHTKEILKSQVADLQKLQGEIHEAEQAALHISSSSQSKC